MDCLCQELKDRIKELERELEVLMKKLQDLQQEYQELQDSSQVCMTGGVCDSRCVCVIAGVYSDVSAHCA